MLEQPGNPNMMAIKSSGVPGKEETRWMQEQQQLNLILSTHLVFPRGQKQEQRQTAALQGRSSDDWILWLWTCDMFCKPGLAWCLDHLCPHLLWHMQTQEQALTVFSEFWLLHKMPPFAVAFLGRYAYLPCHFLVRTFPYTKTVRGSCQAKKVEPFWPSKPRWLKTVTRSHSCQQRPS